MLVCVTTCLNSFNKRKKKKEKKYEKEKPAKKHQLGWHVHKQTCMIILPNVLTQYRFAFLNHKIHIFPLLFSSLLKQ